MHLSVFTQESEGSFALKSDHSVYKELDELSLELGMYTEAEFAALFQAKVSVFMYINRTHSCLPVSSAMLHVSEQSSVCEGKKKYLYKTNAN